MTEFIIIFSTVSRREEAEKIAKSLIGKRLAACVNILDGMTSVYEWKNELCTENEVLMIIKSRKSLFEDIKNEILSLHTYELPEIISFPISEGLPAYLDWIEKNTI